MVSPSLSLACTAGTHSLWDNRVITKIPMPRIQLLGGKMAKHHARSHAPVMMHLMTFLTAAALKSSMKSRPSSLWPWCADVQISDQYLIRWAGSWASAGYDSTHDTYEPECNLRGCQGLLDAFKARHRAAMRRVACRRVRAQQSRGTPLGYFKHA